MAELGPTEEFINPEENQLFEGFSVEQLAQVESAWSNIVDRLENISPSQNLEIFQKVVTAINYEQEAPDLEEHYGVPILAQCRNGVDGGELVIHERFFNKSENQQIYILTHELSHALVAKILSSEDGEKLYQLCQNAPDNSETQYVAVLKQKLIEGKISQREYFSEQIAERLTAYQLGEGRLSGMLAVQAMYAPDPTKVFEGISAEILNDEEQLEQYLLTSEDVNPVIEHARELHSLFDEVLSREILPDEILDDYLEDELIDLETLGESTLLEQYEVAQKNNRETKPGPWQFIRWLFSGSTQK